jgi:hypothetical protein
MAGAGANKGLGQLDKRSRTLELSDVACRNAKVARNYELQSPQSQQVQTLVFSRTGEEYGASMSQPVASLILQVVFLDRHVSTMSIARQAVQCLPYMWILL